MDLRALSPLPLSTSPEQARELGKAHAEQALAAQPWLATYDPPTMGVFPSPFLPANPLLPANWSWFFGNPRSATGTLASMAKSSGMKSTAAYWEGANAAFVKAWHAARR